MPNSEQETSTVLWDEMERLAKDSPCLSELVKRAKEMSASTSLADQSNKTYVNRWNLFTTRCSSMGVPSLPASTATVVHYMAYRSSEGFAIFTLTTDLAAIRSYHLQSGFTIPADHAVVGRLKQANARLPASAGVSKKMAHPRPLADLRAMVECLDEVNYGVNLAVDNLVLLRLKAMLLVA